MPPFLRQTWTVLGVFLNMVAQGMAMSYPSSLLPALRDPDSPIKTDLETASWIASSLGLGGIPGFLLSSFLMDRYGRRIAHGLLTLPGCIAWLLIYFAMNAPTLLIGRLLCGVSAGGSVGLGAVVIGEYTSPRHRGMFLNLKTAAVCTGNMVVHILGYYLSWRAVALMGVLPLVLALLITLTWPESPAWLASKGLFKKSETSFFWLRGSDEDSVKEFEDMRDAQTKQSSKTENWTCRQKTVDFFKKFTRKDFLKPLFIISVGVLLLEVSGRHIFPAYALDIMGEVTGNKAQSFYFTLALDLIITSSAIFSSVLVKMMKRRTLLFSSGFASVTILSIVCSYLFLASRDVISKEYNYIPVGLFILYFILVNLGCTPIPLAFLGELFPLAHRAAGSTICGIIMSLFLNMALHLTPILLVNLKVYGTFALFGFSMAVLLLLLYFTLPETKDKTLQEIEDYFNYGNFKETYVEDVEEKMLKDKSAT